MSIEIRIAEKRSRLITSTNPYCQREHMSKPRRPSELVADIVSSSDSLAALSGVSMIPTQADAITLLTASSTVDARATDKLMTLVYAELRCLAAHYLRRERPDHTLQPTALVNEAYLRLIDQMDYHWQNRAHFIGVAAQLMRRILVDHARTHRAIKRGGRETKVPLDQVFVMSYQRSEELLAVDEALVRLAVQDSRLARIVELRFFGGLSIEETSEVLGISTSTVRRDWNVARAWLYRELTEGHGV